MKLGPLQRIIITGSICAVAFVGCSDDGEDTSSTCADLQALATQVQGLGDVDLVQTGLSGLQAQTDAIEEAWEQARESGDTQFGSELDAVQASIEALGATVEGAIDSGEPIGDVVSQLNADRAQISTDWDALRSAVESEFEDCDLPVAGE